MTVSGNLSVKSGSFGAVTGGTVANDSNLRVELARKTFPAVVSHLSASIKDGRLVISGQDLGPAVSSVWGDSDYEYWLVVDRQYFDRLIARLATKLRREVDVPDDQVAADKLLLDLLRRAWGGGTFESDVDFRRWLNAVHIPSDFSSYV